MTLGVSTTNERELEKKYRGNIQRYKNVTVECYQEKEKKKTRKHTKDYKVFWNRKPGLYMVV